MQRKIAFVGNPNVGKSAWINVLSNANFKVGNWPGVTIEKKEAQVKWDNETYHLIDLPGTYTLDDGRSEEGITARFLKQEKVDLIVNVVDASNLSRNLYLTLLLRELQIPMILIFNFMDEVRKFNIQIEVDALQSQLQIPIYAYSAFDKQGFTAVKKAICEHVHDRAFYQTILLDKEKGLFENVSNLMKQYLPLYVHMEEYEFRQMVFQLMCGDEEKLQQLRAWDMEERFIMDIVNTKIDKDIHHYQVIQSMMQYVEENEQRYAFTRRLDHFLLHPTLGPCFLIAISMILMIFVFRGSAPFNDFIDFLINDMIMKYAQALLAFLPMVAQDLILKGIIAGVGGVLVFIPLMIFLYFILSVLEESGYMSRIAFLLDRFMEHFHLSGKSFVSLLLGFGCNVPAIYATRTLDNEKQKRLTALLVPFMSCGARLPVYMVFAAAFFEGKAAIMILSIYGIGILMALLLAFVFSHFTSFRDDRMFLIELPPYRKPSFQVIRKKVAMEVKSYVRKATSVVMWAMIILWSLSYFPSGKLQDSYIAQFGKNVAVIYEPLGFGSRWESVAALPGSVIAKETIIGFLDQVLLHEEQRSFEPLSPLDDAKKIAFEFGYACKGFVSSFLPNLQYEQPDDTLVSAISTLWQDRYANLRAYCYMVYILLSIPCIMSLQAIGKEYGYKLMFLSISTMLLVPYGVSFLLFQILSRFM